MHETVNDATAWRTGRRRLYGILRAHGSGNSQLSGLLMNQIHAAWQVIVETGQNIE